MYTVASVGSPPLSLADAKEHLRVLHTTDDDYITSLVLAATEWIEQQYDIALRSKTVTEYYDGFDGDIQITIYPVNSVTSVKYYDTDNTLQTITDYTSDLVSRRGRVRVESEPSLYDRPNAIEVIYVAGYATAPEAIIHAIKLLVGDWYKDRERTPGNVKARLLDTVEKLLYAYS